MENKKTKLQKEFNRKRKELSVAYKNYLESKNLENKKAFEHTLTEYKHFVKENILLIEL